MKPAALPASLARSLIPPLEKVVTDEIWEADVGQINLSQTYHTQEITTK